jgi:hypothetical protein
LDFLTTTNLNLISYAISRNLQYAGFDILTVVVMEGSLFWVMYIMPRNPLKIFQRNASPLSSRSEIEPEKKPSESRQ